MKMLGSAVLASPLRPASASAPSAAYAWMSLSACLFAGMNFFVHLSSAHVAWTLVGAVRATIGALVAITVARWRSVSFIPKNTFAMWMRTLFGTVAMGCTFYALASPVLPLGDAATLVNLSPVFLALLAPFVLHEHSGRRVFIALPLSIGGVLLILRPTILFGGAANPAMIVPASVALLGALVSACAMMMLRQVGKTETPEAIATHFSSVAAIGMLVASIPRFSIPSFADLLTMLAAGFCAGFAQLAMTRAYSLEIAARVSPFGYISVAVSAGLGALALHEWPDRLAVLGMLLVVSGGLVVTVAGMREASRLDKVSA